MRQAPAEPKSINEEAHLSEPESTLLRVAAARGGEIQRVYTDAIGNWLRIEGAQDLYDVNYDFNDSEARARHLAALDSLVKRGHVRHEGGILYSLTRSGWDVGRRLGAVDRRTRQLVREQADALYCRERDRIHVEGRQALAKVLRSLASRNVEGTVAHREAGAQILQSIKALAEARARAYMEALAQAGVPLDRTAADALKGELSSVISRATEQCIGWLPDSWLRMVADSGGLFNSIRDRARRIEAAAHRDIEIALQAELLKARKPTD